MNDDVRNENDASEKTIIQFAEKALEKTRNTMHLGSLNIASVSYDASTDQPLIVHGLFANNHPKRRIQLDALLDQTIKEVAKMSSDTFARNAILEMMSAEQTNPQKSDYIFTKHYLKGQTGSCVFLSRCALIELIKDEYTGTTEIFCFKHYDHVFLVLNRPQNSDSENWKTWGEKTIVLDPWINEVFPANMFGKIWGNYVKLPNLKENVIEFIRNKARLTTCNQEIQFEQHIKPLFPAVQSYLKQEPKNIFATNLIMDDKVYREFLSEEEQFSLRPEAT